VPELGIRLVGAGEGPDDRVDVEADDVARLYQLDAGVCRIARVEIDVDPDGIVGSSGKSRIRPGDSGGETTAEPWDK
jgi:hypothetical protein